MSKAETPVSVKIQTIKSPIHAAVRGMRLVAAIKNRAAKSFTGEEVPSFAKPYFVMDALYDGPSSMERFAKALESAGYRINEVF